MVIESKDRSLPPGRIGLAKFRNTEAEFKGFRGSKPVTDDSFSAATLAWLEQLSISPSEIDATDTDDIKLLLDGGEHSATKLKQIAQETELQAKRIRRLADDLRTLPILQQLKDLFESTDDDDLVRGALLIAALDNPDLIVSDYLSTIEAMAKEIRGELADDASELETLAEIDEYLFAENGFHGGRQDYYHPANSHLSRVIDDREGLPITLSILYMELGRQLGLKIEGVGLPGHFVVRYVPDDEADSDQQLIDVFERGNRLTPDDAAKIVLSSAQRVLTEQDVAAQTPQQILTRVLRNLIGSSQQLSDLESLYRYVEALAAINADNVEYRVMRAAVRYQSGRIAQAQEDLAWLSEQSTLVVDPLELEKLRQLMFE